MSNTITTVMLALVCFGLFCGAAAEDVEAGGDQNCNEHNNDHSEETSDGPGEPPEDGMQRSEPRTRKQG